MVNIDPVMNGVYSAVYFNRAAQIAALDPRNVKMQVFQRKEDTIFAGGRFVTNFFEEVPDRNELTIKMLNDGDVVQPWEPVCTIEGPYHVMAPYESVYLGAFARASRVATNASRVVEAANGKPVYFFADRFDIFSTQPLDGYAAAIGGVSAVCTDAMAVTSTLPSVGTMPHALIAYFDGDVVEACRAFHSEYPEVPLHALVDFNNDCVGDSIRCLEEFGQDLAGVRLDTSGNMVDLHLQGKFDIADNKGVNPSLVRSVRYALDEYGGDHVKITVSGGFTAEKIAAFEERDVPVDVYAVGSSLLKNPIDFTADIVAIDDGAGVMVPCAKEGRSEQPSHRLMEV